MKYIIQLLLGPRIKANFTESDYFSRCLQNKTLQCYLYREDFYKPNFDHNEMEEKNLHNCLESSFTNSQI